MMRERPSDVVRLSHIRAPPHSLSPNETTRPCAKPAIVSAATPVVRGTRDRAGTRKSSRRPQPLRLRPETKASAPFDCKEISLTGPKRTFAWRKVVLTRLQSCRTRLQHGHPPSREVAHATLPPASARLVGRVPGPSEITRRVPGARTTISDRRSCPRQWPSFGTAVAYATVRPYTATCTGARAQSSAPKSARTMRVRRVPGLPT